MTVESRDWDGPPPQQKISSLNAMEDAMKIIERKRFSLSALEDTMKEIMSLYKSLPSRPSIEQVEEAQEHIRHADLTLESRKRKLAIDRQKAKASASEDLRVLLDILFNMRVETLEHAAIQDKQKAMVIIQTEERHSRYDAWIQHAQEVLAPHFNGGSPVPSQNYSLSKEKAAKIAPKPLVSTEKDDSLPSKPFLASIARDDPLPSAKESSVEEQKHVPVPNSPCISQSPGLTKSRSMSSMAERGLEKLEPKKPVEKIEPWQPVEKLEPEQPVEKIEPRQPVEKIEPEQHVELDVYPKNQPLSTKLTTPDCFSGKETDSLAYTPVKDPTLLDVVFKSKENILGPSKVSNFLDTVFKDDYKSLDLHGVFLQELEWVPESLGNLTWLKSLTLSGNRLEILPESIGNLKHLTKLDVSANLLVTLPDTIGQLADLEILNIENNKIEELPYTIGQCVSLKEIMADFNKLKALPEAIGKLSQLTSLSVHYNCLKSLPTTMGTMKSLVKLDVHFNQLESLTESLCLVTTLEYLNVASNFTDLKELPESIGRLQSLKHLDASYNHLTVLPDSFAMLTNLETLNLEGNPLKIPPLHVVGQGKDAVLKFMIEHVEEKEREYTKEKKRKKHVLLRLAMMVLRYLKKQSHKGNPDLDIRA